MTLAPGKPLGAYELVAPLGAGGMGEVYRARDTKLSARWPSRCSRPFARDPERITRFEREARVLASLNHPNIAAIYGLEEADGVRAWCWSSWRGETLAERIAAGPVPRRRSDSHRHARWPRGWRRPTRKASSTAISSPPTSSSRRTGT